MSVVTGLTLVVSTVDADNARLIDSTLRSMSPGYSLGQDLTDGMREGRHLTGGSKHPQTDVRTCILGAGLNYLSPEDTVSLARTFLAAEWSVPESAVLMLQPEEGRTWIVRADEPLSVPESLRRWLEF